MLGLLVLAVAWQGAGQAATDNQTRFIWEELAMQDFVVTATTKGKQISCVHSGSETALAETRESVQMLLTEEPMSFVCGSFAAGPVADVCVAVVDRTKSQRMACFSVAVHGCAPPGRLALKDAAKVFSAVPKNFGLWPDRLGVYETRLGWTSLVNVQPGSTFLLSNLSVCEAQLTRTSNSYVARWSLEEPAVALPRVLLEELFPDGQQETLDVPLDFLLNGYLEAGRSLPSGAVRASSDDVIVIGRSALSKIGLVLNGATLQAIGVPMGAKRLPSLCPDCPPLHRYDRATRACADLCGSYLFMSFDSASRTCRNRLSASIVLGALVVALVGGEALIFLIDRYTWKGHAPQPANN